MKKEICYSIMLIVFLSAGIFAQDNYNKDEWLRIDEDLIYSIVHVIDKNDNVTRGLLQGIRGDTLYLFFDRKLNGINLKDITMLTIYDERYGNTALTYGILSALYLGNIIVLTSSDNWIYLDDYEAGELFFYEFCFAVLGGGVGYAIDRSSRKSQRVFLFYDDNDEGIEKFKKFLTNSTDPKKFQLNLSMSSVNTRLSEIRDYTDQYGSSNHTQSSINILRRITATYQISEFLALGAGIANFGEPYIDNYFYSSGINRSSSFNYDGYGYYFIVNVPFRFSKLLVFSLTGGAGSGHVDFKYRSVTTKWVNNAYETNIEDVTINKNVFSALIAGELSLYLFPEISIAAQLDYIYIPIKTPVMGLFKDGTSMGNFSFGLGLGIHF